MIVGAGTSGISAAEYLLNNGFRNVTILEASDRIGGRVYTKKFGDADCELGCKSANFLSDDDTLHSFDYKWNPILLKLSSSPLHWASDFFFFNSSGSQINKETANVLITEFQKIENEILTDTKTHKNLYESFEERITPTLNLIPRNQRSAATRTFCGILNSMRADFGTDLTNVNFALGKKKLKSLSKKKYIKNRCSSDFLNQVVEKFPKNTILLGEPVGKIEQSKRPSEKPICIYGLNGNVFNADFVICTIPLGVLQAIGNVMFDPPLATSKVHSMQKIGVGQVERIFLEFENPVDTWFVGPIQLAWNPKELHNRNHWCSGICYINTVPNSKHILELSVAGFQAEDMRLASDEDVALEINTLLHRFQGTTKIPLPKSILRSNWTKDIRFLGSLVFPTVLTKSYDLEEQQQPMFSVHAPNSTVPRLLFAGDSTDKDLLGTINGARMSGVREAMRIVHLVKHNTS